ncbi:DUF397 domain-containing protein [Kitasatospora sp. NPDC091207]
MADLAPGHLVRDSKDPGGPVLSFPSAAWQAFVDAVRADAFPAPGC